MAQDNTRGSHREILRSSSIVGGAALVNIAVGLAKTKLVALMVGPAGMGLIVLLQTLMQTVASIASMSLGQAGTRQIAEAAGAGDAARLTLVRRALVIGAGGLATVSGVVFWIASGPLAGLVSSDPAATRQAGWLAIGVAATVASQSQVAVLMGFRRIGDFARINILSVVISALIGTWAVWMWGVGGAAAFIVVPVIATYVIGHIYVRRLPKWLEVDIPPSAIALELKTMLGFGIALTVAAIGVNIGQLAARGLIENELGAAAVGWFQASWLISVTYITFVLQAMGADFYPRLTAVSHDAAEVNRLVNEQTEVGLLLAAPVLLAALGGAPWVIRLLYSREFDPAVSVLQWQILGDVLKIASWPLGYLMLATNSSRTYMVGEFAAIIVLVAVMAFGLPRIGLEASGLAVIGLYLFYLPYAYLFARRKTRFRWTTVNIRLVTALFALCAATLTLSRLSPIAGAVAGAAGSAAAAALFLRRLEDAMPAPVARLIARVRRAGSGT